MAQTATTTATIIPFPERDKGRKRKSKGLLSQGRWAMLQFSADGENIEHIEQYEVANVNALEMTLYLCEKIINASPHLLPKVRRSCGVDAAFGRDRHHKAVALAVSDLIRTGKSERR